jgi:hypothetical protein
LISTESFYVSSVLNALPVTGGTISGNLVVTGTANITGVTTLTGGLNTPLAVASGGTGVATSTGTGAVVLGTSPTITGATITVASTAAPAFSAYAGSIQSVTTLVYTKLQMNTEEFDTNSNFDSTTNYRFTPTVAGYYFITISGNPNSTVTDILVAIYKNGAAFKYGTQASTTVGVLTTALIYLNGSTDYVEAYGRLVGTTPSWYSGAPYQYFQGFLARSA